MWISAFFLTSLSASLVLADQPKMIPDKVTVTPMRAVISVKSKGYHIPLLRISSMPEIRHPAVSGMDLGIKNTLCVGIMVSCKIDLLFSNWHRLLTISAPQ